MVADDERRRVARKLREYASWDGGEDCPVDCADWGERVLNLLGCGDMEGECYAALADLIDPDTTTDTTKTPPDTTKCDRDTPQKVAEEMFGKMRHSTREEADAYDAMLKSKSVEIHPVDRDELLALADEMQRELDECESDHEIAGKLENKIHRIREAVGWSHDGADKCKPAMARNI